MESRLLAEPVLVGREKELEELQRCLASAKEGKGKTVFIRGEAGTGKTRLVKEFLKVGGQKNAIALVGWCLSNVSGAYFPFIEAFENFVSARKKSPQFSMPKKVWRGLEAATSTIENPPQSKLNEHESLPPEVWKDVAFSTVAKALKSLSEFRTTLLVVDDLHWADSASLSLLYYLSRVLAAERIVIVGTFRSEEIQYDSDRRANPLVEIIRLMKRDDLLTDISLSNLSQTDAIRLAENIVGGSLDSEFAGRLLTESQGNPLFIVESTKMLLENAHIVYDKGVFHLSTTDLHIPAKIKDIILRRADKLKPDQRRLIDLAAVIGERFDPVLLGAALSKDTINTLEELRRISNSTSLICCDDSYYRFDHAKSREVIYWEIPAALKRQYHARIAETLEKATKATKEIPADDLTYHYTQAGNEKKAVEFAVVAGKEALARFSNREAARYFDYVIQCAETNPEFADKKIIALEGIGDAYYGSSMFSEAGKTFEKIAVMEKGVAKLRVLRKALDSAFFQGDTIKMAELLKRAEPYAAEDRLEYARMLYRKGRLLLLQGNIAGSLEEHEEALRIFEEENSLWDVAWHTTGLGVASSYLGKFDKGTATFLRAIALLGDVGDCRRQMEVYWSLGYGLIFIGFMPESLRVLEKSAEIAERIGDYKTVAWANAMLEWDFALMGNTAEALARNQNALLNCAKTDSPFTQGLVYGVSIYNCILVGDFQHADEFFEKFTKLPKEILVNPIIVAPLIMAVYFAGKKMWDESSNYFRQCLDTRGPLSHGHMPRIAYARVLESLGKDEEAKMLQGEALHSLEALEKFLENNRIQASLMNPRKVAVGQTFDLRLDMINVCRSVTQLKKLESLIPPSFKVNLMPEQCVLQGCSIDLMGKKVLPFEVETVKLKLESTREGTFPLNPIITYLDNEGKTLSYALKPRKIVVEPAISTELPAQPVPVGAPLEFDFKTNEAKKAFDYLLDSFAEDYMRRRLPLEWSGWRTLNEIKKHTRLSARAVYGTESHRGHAISELEHRGIAEVRVFSGERGRGGNISKVRICYEKEPVRRKVDEKIMKIGKNR